ncbi:MAG: hypothetical protein ABFD69_07780 [Candidatus Sumerlaeia bacterium]
MVCLRAWKRWWRHPDRDLYRAQMRRGLRFWFRPPWLFLLPVAILLKWAAVYGPWLFGIRMNSLYLLIIMLPSVFVLIAWANCLQDALESFRGARLTDILLTSSSPRRYFPAFLMAPITTWVVVTAIGTIVILPFDVWSAYHNIMSSRFLPSKSEEYIRLMCWLRAIWQGVGIVASSWLMAGVTASAAALSIGYSKNVAMIRSLATALILYNGTLILLRLSVYPIISMIMYFALSTYDPYLVSYSYGAMFWIFAAVLGRGAWRFGIRRLHGAQTVKRLQAAVEAQV